MPEDKNVFIHHVFFWLADPKKEEDRKALITGLEKLAKIPTIKRFHIGKPADTSRSVIDATYSVSWCIYFADAADQQSYQKDPVHLRFVDTCSHLWSKVLVYDTEDA